MAPIEETLESLRNLSKSLADFQIWMLNASALEKLARIRDGDRVIWLSDVTKVLKEVPQY